jgi:hypothetical protein
MATYRDYGENVASTHQILSITEYIKEEDMMSNHVWHLQDSSDDKKVQIKKTVAKHDVGEIPTEIKWAIETDYVDGAKLLANYFNKVVVVHINHICKYKLPKESLNNMHVNGSGGAFETFDYVKAGPKNFAINPDRAVNIDNMTDENELNAINETKILLTIKPNKDHYMNTTERRKSVRHGFCPCCMIASTPTAATKGSGKKSSKKTKGRAKRNAVDFST